MKHEIPIDAAAKRIFRFALSKTDNVQDAEDLTQEIMLSLVRSSEKLPDIRNIDAWITRICTYTWTNFYRRERRHWRTGDDDFDRFDGPWSADSFIERDEHEKAVDRLRTEVGYLNTVHREVIVRRYFENASISEISNDLDIPGGTVKWYLHQAKKRLKEHMMNGIEISYETEQRYRPVRLGVGHSGSPGTNGEPNSTLESLLAQNVAYAAYMKPLSIDQIARNLGVGAAFVEDIIRKLEYSDLVVRKKNAYQTAMFIRDFDTERQYMDSIIRIASEISAPLHGAARSAIPDVRSVGFPGSDLDDDILLWNLLPFYLMRISGMTEERKRLGAVSPPERKDGGKYIAMAMLIDEFEKAAKESGPEAEIYKRFECRGIKTRSDRTSLASFQVDSYFAGGEWREFNQPDLQKLARIAEVTRSGEAYNDLDRLYISEYVSKGYLSSQKGRAVFRFPFLGIDEKARIDEIMDAAFDKIDGKQFFEGIIDSQYEFWRSVTPDSVSDHEVRYKAMGISGDMMLGCMEWLERNGRLRTPKKDEKPALETLVYEYELK